MTSQQPSGPAEATDDDSAGRSPIAWLTSMWRAVFFEPDALRGFQDTKDALREQLRTDDEDKADGILKDATDAFDRLQARVDGAERRARRCRVLRPSPLAWRLPPPGC